MLVAKICRKGETNRVPRLLSVRSVLLISFLNAEQIAS